MDGFDALDVLILVKCSYCGVSLKKALRGFILQQLPASGVTPSRRGGLNLTEHTL